MTQLAVRIDDSLVAGLDDLVEKKEFPNRSEGIRAALKLLLEQRRRVENARRDVEAYRKFPETEDDLAGLAQYATVDVTEEEPW